MSYGRAKFLVAFLLARVWSCIFCILQTKSIFGIRVRHYWNLELKDEEFLSYEGMLVVHNVYLYKLSGFSKISVNKVYFVSKQFGSCAVFH